MEICLKYRKATYKSKTCCFEKKGVKNELT